MQANHTWTVKPGSWPGWFEVACNGVSLGQHPHYWAAGALEGAMTSLYQRQLAPYYQARADAAGLSRVPLAHGEVV